MSVLLRYRTLKNGTKSYYLDISHNNERYREFLHAKIKKELDKDDKMDIQRLAEAIRNKREKELIIDEHDIQDFTKSNICFTTYFENYDKEYKKNDKRKIHSSFLQFKKHFGKIKAKSLNHRQCESYLEFLNLNLTSDTVSSYFGVFRKVLHEAERDGIIKKDPTKHIKVKKIHRKLNKQVLTIDEITSLINTECGNPEIKRAFIFSLNTGLGLAEIKKLEWSKINDGKISHFTRAKTDTPLVIPLNKDALFALGRREKISNMVFDLPTSTNGCNKVLNNWVKRAGITKHITWYCARHTFACNLLIYGANQKTVANLMGHTNSTITDKYLNHVSTLNDSAVNLIPSASENIG
ncbi:MAG: site-specific integrase [Saprospiraceae bacterium]|nr:site-specific integrase [Saprospiraceae bacterium]MBP6566692.1 site-specific integrase [Saprospiraceae bacterium]